MRLCLALRRLTLALALISIGVGLARAAGKLSLAPLKVRGRFDPKGLYHSPTVGKKLRSMMAPPKFDRPRYPVVLVHGIIGWSRAKAGFLYADYFNGVASDLKARGVPVLITKQDWFASVEDRAQQIKEQIEAAGFERFHLVAHSMGGIDCRYLISHLGIGDRAVSLTTVSSPHHGSWYADFALKWVFEKQKFWKVWDKLFPRDAIHQMSVKYMTETFNPQTPNNPGTRYFSFSGVQSFAGMPPPLSGMGLVVKAMETMAVKGKKLGLGSRLAMRTLLPSDLRKDLLGISKKAAGSNLDTSWVDPRWVGWNDGIISSSSAVWGEHQVVLQADHFDQIGWLGFFRSRRLYHGIFQMLADQGL